LTPTQPVNGYGWVVEIDPQGVFPAVKRTALGRFDHENTAYMLDSDNTLAIYMGDDSTPGCVYKFVAANKYNPTNRAANKTCWTPASSMPPSSRQTARANGKS
jgi:uncharacterized protein